MIHGQAVAGSLAPAGARRGSYAAGKRAIDVVVSALGLIVVSPLLAALAVAIGLVDRSPPQFRQTRLGQGGSTFVILKLRTLSTDGKRATFLGRFLRRYYLDELPQLWNVLVGEMSLVGPRPHVPDMTLDGTSLDHFVPAYADRLAVVPGLTGLAQARGFSGPLTEVASLRDRIACDLYYVNHASLRLDIEIIWRTLWRQAVRGTGR